MQQIFELKGKYFKTYGGLIDLSNYNRYLNFLNPDTFYKKKGDEVQIISEKPIEIKFDQLPYISKPETFMTVNSLFDEHHKTMVNTAKTLAKNVPNDYNAFQIQYSCDEQEELIRNIQKANSFLILASQRKHVTSIWNLGIEMSREYINRVQKPFFGLYEDLEKGDRLITLEFRLTPTILYHRINEE